MSRRSFLRVGALGVGGLSLAELLRLRALGAADQNARHKSVIIVFLNGGASQLDMFDMKPNAPAEFRGEFQPISTNVPGVSVSELLPNHAKMMDKMSIVNGLQVITSGHNLYEASTGFAGNVRPKRPAVGSVVSRFGSNRPDMPAFVGMAGESDPEFLGPRHAGFAPNGGLMSDLYRNRPVPEDRLQLFRSVDRLDASIDAHDELLATATFTNQALEMLSSSKIRDAFDVKKEPEEIRARYADIKYGGTGLLQALRLAEAGASLITVYGPGNNLWDTHKNNFPVLRDKILPHYDRSIPAMIEDLYARGLQDDVLIAIYGEFGRTPRVNKAGGRDHYPQSGYVQLIGGGLQMGQVIGDTGVRGDFDISRSKPYTIQNLIATMYHVLGIDPSIKTPDNFGRPQYLLEQREVIRELI